MIGFYYYDPVLKTPLRGTIAMLKKLKKITLPALSLLAAAALFSSCAGSDDVSSMPWSEPEPWEQQPSFGVPY